MLSFVFFSLCFSEGETGNAESQAVPATGIVINNTNVESQITNISVISSISTSIESQTTNITEVSTNSTNVESQITQTTEISTNSTNSSISSTISTSSESPASSTEQSSGLITPVSSNSSSGETIPPQPPTASTDPSEEDEETGSYKPVPQPTDEVFGKTIGGIKLTTMSFVGFGCIIVIVLLFLTWKVCAKSSQNVGEIRDDLIGHDMNQQLNDTDNIEIKIDDPSDQENKEFI